MTDLPSILFTALVIASPIIGIGLVLLFTVNLIGFIVRRLLINDLEREAVKLRKQIHRSELSARARILREYLLDMRRSEEKYRQKSKLNHQDFERAQLVAAKEYELQLVEDAPENKKHIELDFLFNGGEYIEVIEEKQKRSIL